MAPPGGDVIIEVSSALGSPIAASTTPAQDGNVCTWDDPTNDFDPTDAVLLYSAPIVSANEDTGTLNAYSIPNIAVEGVFFVGVSGAWLLRAVGISCGSLGAPYCTSNANSVDPAGAPIAALGTVNFQCWYRDPADLPWLLSWPPGPVRFLGRSSPCGLNRLLGYGEGRDPPSPPLQ